MECICWGNGDSYLAAGTRKGNVFLYNQLTKQTFAAFTLKHSSKVSPRDSKARRDWLLVCLDVLDFLHRLVSTQRFDRNNVERRTFLFVELSIERIGYFYSFSQSSGNGFSVFSSSRRLCGHIGNGWISLLFRCHSTKVSLLIFSPSCSSTWSLLLG